MEHIRHVISNKQKVNPQFTNISFAKEHNYEYDKDGYPYTIDNSKHPGKKGTHF